MEHKQTVEFSGADIVIRDFRDGVLISMTVYEDCLRPKVMYS